VKSKWLSVSAIVFLILGVSLAFPKNKHGNEGHGKHKDSGKEVLEIRSEPVFTPHDTVLLGNWYREGKGLPPGLAKREQPPPGLEKHLRKGGTLPPGLMKKIRPLPVVIERRLPALPAGYRRAVISGSVVIMNERSGLVLDVFALF
jgi:hypothetical protein